jgi:ribonucleotide reductase alpha subunit
MSGPDSEAADAVLIATRRCLPGVPMLANAGRSNLLAACYGIEPEDSLASIYETLGLAARIQQGAGGALYRSGPGCAPCTLPDRTDEWL